MVDGHRRTCTPLQVNQVGRTRRSGQIHPNIVPMVHMVRYARGCSLRGALELLIKTGFIAIRTYGFLDKIPKDDWSNLIYNRIGVDARALFKNAQSETENKA